MRRRPAPNRLRVWRAEKRKTQFELARRTGINQTRISLIENSYVEPSPDDRSALARALKVSEAELFPASVIPVSDDAQEVA